MICSSCAQNDFPPAKAQAVIGAAPIHLDAEQVVLTMPQVDCGVQSDLWDPPTEVSERKIAHLTAQGRALEFDDDVVVTEPGYSQPYAQIRGAFPVQLADGSTLHDDGQYGKRVEGRLSVIISHPCFSGPLPLMGVRRGKFNQDAAPAMHFSLQGDGWHFDNLIH